MKNATVGFRVHSGWTAMVAVSLESRVPVVLSRQRLHLVDPFIYKLRQPYHTAARVPRQDASNFIRKTRNDAKKLGVHGLRELQDELKEKGYRLDSGALLLASGRVLPELNEILLSHALIHTADGEFFRDVVRDACDACNVRVTCSKERELLESGEETLSTRMPVLLKRLTELGRPFGSPWTQDEKFAALAAWLALART